MYESKYYRDNKEIADLIKRTPVLKMLDEVSISRFVELSKVRYYEPEENIITEGDIDTWIYFLLQGHVKIIKSGLEIGELRRMGDIFGEMAVIDGFPRNATVMAFVKTVCLAVDAKELAQTGEREHVMLQAVFYKIFSEILASRLRTMNDEVIRLKTQLEHKTASEDYIYL